MLFFYLYAHTWAIVRGWCNRNSLSCTKSGPTDRATSSIKPIAVGSNAVRYGSVRVSHPIKHRLIPREPSRAEQFLCPLPRPCLHIASCTSPPAASGTGELAALERRCDRSSWWRRGCSPSSSNLLPRALRRGRPCSNPRLDDGLAWLRRRRSKERAQVEPDPATT